MLDQRIRNICHDGFQTSKETQEVFDKEFLPRADQILALPETNRFRERPPNKSVILWTLSKECYPLLRYLIRNGWNLNSIGDCTGYCPTLLGYVHMTLVILNYSRELLRVIELQLLIYAQ